MARTKITELQAIALHRVFRRGRSEMKRMKEHEVLHLCSSIRGWRVIAGCIRNTAKVTSGKERAELFQLAERIEAHLPSGTSNPKE